MLMLPTSGRYSSPRCWAAAVNAAGCHVVGHDEEPDPLPLVENGPHVFGRKDELLRADGRVAGVDREQAAGVGHYGRAKQNRQNKPTHRSILHENCNRLMLIAAAAIRRAA